MIYDSLDSSRWEESNGSNLIFVGSIVNALLRFKNLVIFYDNFPSSNYKIMIFKSLDSSHWDDSNGNKIILIGLILIELWQFKNF